MKIDLSKESTIQEALPYTALAQVYDQLMLHVNYRRWAKYVLAILKREHFRSDKRLLDIGCGTGRHLQEMAKMGQHGDGCDKSENMLQIARVRVQDSVFYQSALPELSVIPANTYAVFTCLYDTMNYLLDETMFKEALSSIHCKLKAPGIFVFDLVSEAHCKNYFQDYMDSEVINKDFAYSRESHYDQSENMQYNWIRIYTREGIFEEEHRQRIYDFDEVKALINQSTGFRITHVYEEFSFDNVNSRSGRAHFVLKKE